MKKILFSSLLLTAFMMNVHAQNTIPTTTVNGALSVNDSLKVSRDISSSGSIKADGEVVARDTMRAQKDVIVDGSVIIKHKLTVEGNAVFKNNLKAKEGIMFDNTNGISYTHSTATNPNIFQYGSKVSGIPEACAAAPQSWANHQFGGMMQIYSTDGNGDYVPTHGLLNFQTWSGGSSIDASIGGTTLSNGSLLLNYFCGNDTYINTGSNGGVVSTGKNVEIGFPTRNAQIALNIAVPLGVTKGLSITNPALTTTNKTVFEVSSTGKTNIGTGRPLATGIAGNALLSVDGLILAKEIRVAIANTHWADYVFEKNYKLMPLKDLEVFIIKNKHLPEVPNTKEVSENGIDVTEMNAVLLKKIEELTLYTIDLKKQLDAQQKEINSIKK
jgi:hypothetical protein